MPAKKAAPEVAPAPVAEPVVKKTRAKKDRSAYTHAVFVGASNTPRLWAKSEDEVKAWLAKCKPSKLIDVTVAKLSPVTVKVDVQIG